MMTWLEALVAAKGSDLHLKVGSPPRMRVDGRLVVLDGPNLTPDMAEELLRDLIRPDLHQQFQKSNEADFAYSLPGVGRFRVNAFRQRGSVGMVLRRVQEGAMSIGELGLPPVIARLAEQPRGLVLVTGPTGSGKTTTLAAMIDHVNANNAVHIVTIEDPIEVLHADKLGMVNQREVRVDTDDFTIAMRAAMRQDPDVILVGEIRDSETLKTSLAAAETGHLVLSTLHTADAAETVNRCIDLFPPTSSARCACRWPPSCAASSASAWSAGPATAAAWPSSRSWSTPAAPPRPSPTPSAPATSPRSWPSAASTARRPSTST
jgi:twitching motility protein PilT